MVDGINTWCSFGGGEMGQYLIILNRFYQEIIENNPILTNTSDTYLIISKLLFQWKQGSLNSKVDQWGI